MRKLIDYWKVRFDADNSSWLKVIAIIFCIGILIYSFSAAYKSSLQATPTEINIVIAAAKVDQRAQIADKLVSELNKKPSLKVWELDRIKYDLGLRYVDSNEFKKKVELQNLKK